MVEGKSLKELLVDVLLELFFGQDVICFLSNLFYVKGYFVIFKGNFVSEGSVVKISGVKIFVFIGLVWVFESEEDCFVVIFDKKIQVGDVVVVCNEGFVGGLGMWEMLVFILVIVGQGLGDKVVLIIDGCFSGGIYGLVVGYVVFEVVVGGIIGLV